MWKRYSSKKKPKYYKEINDNEISIESNYIDEDKERKTGLALNIADILGDITEVERK